METVTLQAEIERERAHVLQHCTACGKCVEACPMMADDSDRLADPAGVVRGVLGILRDGNGSAAGKRWAEVCTGSGKCIPACPEPINPRKMLALTRLRLLELAETPIVPKDNLTPRAFFRRLTNANQVLAVMQMAPEKYQWLTGLGQGKKARAEVLFYFGCNPIKTADIVFNVNDVFDRLGLDFEVVGGSATCCGITFFRQGDLEGSGRMMRNSLAAFARFEPREVVTWCPTCQIHFGDFGRNLQRVNYTFVHITEFLARRLDDLRRLFVRPIPKRVALHSHAGLPGAGDYARKLLAAIPGLTLIEVEQHEDRGYICSSLAHLPGAKDHVLDTFAASARAAGVEVVADIYHACHRDLLGSEQSHGFEVRNFMSLIAEAMGVEHEDQFRRFRLMRDVEELLARTADRLASAGLHPDEVRDTLAREVFGPASSRHWPKGEGRGPAEAEMA
jgi:Fe-S oxidoreductase